MLKNTKKIPIDQLDTDSAPKVRSDKSAINMRNVRVHSVVDGEEGNVQNTFRNMKMPDQVGKIPAGSERVAEYSDPGDRFIIWFTHKPGSPGDDQINYYDLIEKKYWLVAKSNLGINGEIKGGLNFDIGVYYDLSVVNGMLFWTGDHEPRKIHIGAAIKACNPTAVDPIPYYNNWQYDWFNTGDDDTGIENLSLAVKPPAYPPAITKRKDSTADNNNIFNESFQFAFQFLYHTNEYSTLSMFSQSSLINSEADKDNNVIEVVINPLEYPFPQGAKELRLLVKVGSSQRAFVIHKWDIKNVIPGQLLVFNFYGGFFGEAVDTLTRDEPFHSVPERAGTLSIIKNRLFLGDCVKGKDTPQVTSMKMTLGDHITISDGPDSTKKIQFVMYRGKRKNGLDRPRFYYSGIFVKLEDVVNPGYYLVPGTEIRLGAGFTGVPAVFAPYPPSVLLSALVFKGRTLSEIIEATRSVTIASLYESYIMESPSQTIVVDGLIPPGNAQATPVFLHNSQISGGICFFDRYMRKTGTVTNEGVKVDIPARNFALSRGYNNVTWSLDNTNAIDEIPVDSIYYAPLLTRNSRTQSLVSGKSIIPRYGINNKDGIFQFDDGKEDTESGNDDTAHLVYTIATVAIGLELTSLINAGLGYVFTEKDMCILITDDDKIHKLPVLGVFGKYLAVAPKDIGSLVGKKIAFEIYTPYKVDTNDLFYEVGQLYPIESPGTANRKYSTLSGSFLPDFYVITRRNGSSDSFVGYATSPNDLYYKRWDSHFGRGNIVTTLGKVDKYGNICFGDPFIPGTSVNGISAFHALNEENLPAELGRVRRLISTNKIQGEGGVLVALCTAGETSLYIGEQELLDASGNSVLVKSDKVIGQISALRGNFGISHPESAKEFKGQIFWYSHNRRSFVRYASNGVFPISNFNFESASYDFSRSLQELIDSGFLVIVNGGIDPVFKEYLINRRIYNKISYGQCPMPINLIVENSPTDELPQRVFVRWDHSTDNTTFAWQILDKNGYVLYQDQNFVSAGPNAVLELNMLADGVAYTFQIQTRCSSTSRSNWVQAAIVMPGAEVVPTPGDGCVALTLNEPLFVLPNAVVGQEYTFDIDIDGSLPMSMSSIVKPSWLAISVVNGFVRLVGTPPVQLVNTSVSISFRLSNCWATPLDVSRNLSLVAPAESAPTCIAPAFAIPNFQFPDPIEGVYYLAVAELTGSRPMTISEITKPDWATITLVSEGFYVRIDGTPPWPSAGSQMVFSFKIKNCHQEIISFYQVVNIQA